eukprot:evm.model.scf_1421.1 EVM.evm.TU.scf_1421.1   scf_1421:6275-18096(-)
MLSPAIGREAATAPPRRGTASRGNSESLWHSEGAPRETESMPFGAAGLPGSDALSTFASAVRCGTRLCGVPEHFKGNADGKESLRASRKFFQTSADEDLLSAAADGDTVAATKALDAGANPNATTSSGDPALVIAAAAGSAGVLRLLLDAGADIDAQGQSGFTALAAAVEANELSAVRFLLKAGADTEIQTESKKDTPLTLAVFNGHGVSMVTALLDAGANVDGRRIGRWTPLMIAAHLGDAPVSRLLIERGADVNARGSLGTTPLIRAAVSGSVAVIGILLDAGARTEDKAFQSGNTALLMAAWLGHTRAVRQLIERGADAFALSTLGLTGLHWAAEFPGNQDILEIFIDEGIDIDAKTDFGVTALNLAALHGNIENVKYLLEKGADASLNGSPVCGCLDFEPESNSPPCPTGNCDASAVKELNGIFGLNAEAGLDVDAQSGFGITPIERAAYFGNIDGVRHLLSKGADPSIGSGDGILDEPCGCMHNDGQTDLPPCPPGASCSRKEEINEIAKLMGRDESGASPRPPKPSGAPNAPPLAIAEAGELDCNSLPTVLERLECAASVGKA